MKDRIAKSVFWIAWAKGGLQLVAFLGTVVLARLLSPSDFGLIALTGMWIGSLGLLAEMGLSAAVIQFRDLSQRELNFCFWLSLGVSLVGYGLLYAVAPLIEEWFSAPRLADVLRVVSLTLPLVGLRTVPDSLLRKSLALDKVSQIEIIGAFVALPVQIGLAIGGAGVWSLVAGIVTGQLLQTAGTFAFVDWRPSFKWGSDRSKTIAAYSLTTMGGRLCWSTYEQMDVFMLGKYSGDALVGLYSLAKQIALLPVHKLSVVVNQVAGPAMAEAQSDGSKLRGILFRQLRMVASLTMPACAGLALVADDLIHVVLTDKWMPAVPVLKILCIYTMWRSLTVGFPSVLFARYQAQFMFKWNIILLVIMSVSFWVGAAWNGALGIALVWVTVFPVITLAHVRKVMNELEVSWAMMAAQLRPIILATVMMCGMVGLLRYLMPVPTSLPEEILRLVSACSLGAFTYIAAILWQGKLLVSEFAEVFGWFLQGFRSVPATK